MVPIVLFESIFKNIGRKSIKRLLYGNDSWTYTVFGTEKTDKTTAKGSYRQGILLLNYNQTLGLNTMLLLGSYKNVYIP